MELMFSNNLLSAFVVEVVRAFQRQFPGGYLGRTAVQKLVYFCKAFGVPVPCSFEIYNYGPYSDRLTFTVDALIADDVLLDVSNEQQRYSNYKLSEIGSDLQYSREIKQQVTGYTDQIDRIVASLGGYKPEQLELIATLHFIHQRLKSILRKDPPKTAVLAEFDRIKRNKFPKEEVDSWYEALTHARAV